MGYESPTLTGYNANPPPDDGTETDANKTSWQKHLDKIGDPLKNYAEAIDAAVESAFAEVTVPPGTIAMTARTTDPDGWLILDGRTGLNSTTDDTLVDLFGVIGIQYGGTGPSDFALPDVRGKFARGFDNGAGNDPDAGNRTDRGDGTMGDEIGTNQPWQMRDHGHRQTGNSGSTIAAGTGGGFALANTPSDLGSPNEPNQNVPIPAANLSSNQTHPINIAFNYMIKK